MRVVLSPEPARRGTQRAGFYPKAYVIEESASALKVWPLWPEDKSAVSTKAVANRIMLRAFKAWARQKGLTGPFTIYVPKRS